MKWLEKIKSAIFVPEDEENEDLEKHNESIKKNDRVVRKIDIEKTTISNEDKGFTSFKYNEEEKEVKKPIIFDDEDFLSDTKELSFKEIPKKEDKILYGGEKIREKEANKDKFKPSPNISPVYGILKDNSNNTSSISSDSRKPLDSLFTTDIKKEIDFDSIREKAYGSYKNEEVEEVEDNNSLLYEMEEKEMPHIAKVTIGDAEEYFEDLGLEYDVDYKDLAKEKVKIDNVEVEEKVKVEEKEEAPKAMTRSKKNKELSEKIEDSSVDEDTLESKDVVDLESDDDTDEKNLYDLIDMMYESKE